VARNCYGLHRVIRSYLLVMLADASDAALSMAVHTDGGSQQGNKPNELDREDVAAPQIAREYAWGQLYEDEEVADKLREDNLANEPIMLRQIRVSR